MNYETPKRRKLDEIFDEVLIEFPEVSIQLVELNAKLACVDFCEISHYWQEHIGGVYVVEGLYEYDIPVPRSTNIVEVMRVFLGDDGTEHNFDKSVEDMGSQYRYSNPLNRTIMLHPNNLLKEKSVQIIACLKPDINAEKFEVAAHILDDYRSALVSGTKARLFKLARRDWSDHALSSEHNRIFLDESRHALRRSGRGYALLPDSLINKPRRYY